jgi:hypothetical protein
MLTFRPRTHFVANRKTRYPNATRGNSKGAAASRAAQRAIQPSRTSELEKLVTSAPIPSSSPDDFRSRRSAPTIIPQQRRRTSPVRQAVPIQRPWMPANKIHVSPLLSARLKQHKPHQSLSPLRQMSLGANDDLQSMARARAGRPTNVFLKHDWRR